MARSPRVRPTLRRLAGAALEDFGLRRRARPAAPVTADPPVADPVTATTPVASPEDLGRPVDGVDEVAPTAVADATPVADPTAPASQAPPPADVIPRLAPAGDLAPGVVWHGAARRSPELQRFCEHLEGLRRVS